MLCVIKGSHDRAYECLGEIHSWFLNLKEVNYVDRYAGLKSKSLISNAPRKVNTG